MKETEVNIGSKALVKSDPTLRDDCSPPCALNSSIRAEQAALLLDRSWPVVDVVDLYLPGSGQA